MAPGLGAGPAVLTGGLAAAGAGLVGLLGGWDTLLSAVVVAALVELAARLLVMLYQVRADAMGLWRDVIRHLASACAIALAVLLDRFLGDAGAIRALVCLGLVGVAGAAILNHLDALGLPVSRVLGDAIAALLARAKVQERGEEE